MSKIIRIGTRASRLAVVQAQIVADHIRRTPGLEPELITITTTGDKILDKTLDKIGGKGVFVRELDQALENGEVDLCVHSCKDLPADSESRLPVVAVSPREDPRDVLILPAGDTEPDPAKPLGCSSQRRKVQLEKLYPGHPIAPVRGNVLTRLEKLERGEFSGLVLAAAGIKRLGLWDRVSRVFTPEEILPAACQGLLAVQGRPGEDYSYMDGFSDSAVWDVFLAERAFIHRLDWGCGAPVGVLGRIEEAQLRLWGMIAGQSGLIYSQLTAHRQSPRELGIKLAESMLEGVDPQWQAAEK